MALRSMLDLGGREEKNSTLCWSSSVSRLGSDAVVVKWFPAQMTTFRMELFPSISLDVAMNACSPWSLPLNQTISPPAAMVRYFGGRCSRRPISRLKSSYPMKTWREGKKMPLDWAGKMFFSGIHATRNLAPIRLAMREAAAIALSRFPHPFTGTTVTVRPIVSTFDFTQLAPTAAGC